MPAMHIADLDEEKDEPTPAPSSSPSPHRWHSWLKILLEVALITAGVFLGLAGESWRETREHRELAEQSLRRITGYRAGIAFVPEPGALVAGLAGYFGDTALHEQLLLERYDKLR